MELNLLPTHTKPLVSILKKTKSHYSFIIMTKYDFGRLSRIAFYFIFYLLNIQPQPI